MKRTTILLAALALSASGALAKDKMDKVDIAIDGIDIKPIVVRAGADGYKSVSTPDHVFFVRGYGQAKKGYRIVSAWFFSGPKNGASFERALLPRDYGSGKNRTVTRPVDLKIPLSKVTWDGPSPLAACNANFQTLKKAGFSPKDILSKTHALQVRAVIGFGAAADREGRTASPVGLGGGSTYETRSLSYTVRVECRS